MNQSEKRQFLIHELLKEAPEFQGLSVPADSQETAPPGAYEHPSVQKNFP